MAGGTAILTAAHCVTDSSGKIIATGGSACFYGGPADPLYSLDFGTVPGIERVALGAIHVAPGYTGDVIDQNDLAIIFLDGAAPTFATPYRLTDLSDPAGRKFTVAGFGNRGRGGATGAIEGSFSRLREGLNRFDFAFGNPLFGTGWPMCWAPPSARFPTAGCPTSTGRALPRMTPPASRPPPSSGLAPPSATAASAGAKWGSPAAIRAARNSSATGSSPSPPTG